MKTLDYYREAVREALAIGKDIGDTLAWFFYQNENDLLRRHLEQPEVRHTPPGIGGFGELEFVKKMPIFDRKLVIYHGITSFLRIGDISLVDMETLRVSSVAELKTRQADAENLSITIVCYRPGNESASPSQAMEVTQRDQNLALLDPTAKARLVRQMRKMEDAFTGYSVDANFDFDGITHHDSLRQLIGKMSRRNMAWEKAGDGLLLIGIRKNRSKGLSVMLLSRSRAYTANRRLPPGSIAARIHNEASTENALLLSHLKFGFDPGYIPAFWLDLDLDFVKDVMFRRLRVFSAYNPAFLFKKLRANGFTVIWDSDQAPRIEYHGAVFKASLDSLVGPVKSIQQHLLREETVIKILLDPLQGIESGELPRFESMSLFFDERLSLG